MRRLLEKKPNVLINSELIRGKVSELASRIKEDYSSKNPLLVCVLKGGFIFMADLVRYLDMPLEIDFIRVSSYRAGTESSGKIEVVQDLKAPIKGRDVLVVEDIIDTGLSLSFIINLLQQRKPASLKLCALLDKPSRRKAPVHIDYLGFTVPDKFLVGYGLDFNEQFRALPDVCCLKEN